LVSGYNASYVMRCAAADFNLDGHLDVALTGNGKQHPVFLLWATAQGGSRSKTAVVNGYGRGLASADFDHDGCPTWRFPSTRPARFTSSTAAGTAPSSCRSRLERCRTIRTAWSRWM
jgi:hypothetical protein